MKNITFEVRVYELSSLKSHRGTKSETSRMSGGKRRLPNNPSVLRVVYES